MCLNILEVRGCALGLQEHCHRIILLYCIIAFISMYVYLYVGTYVEHFSPGVRLEVVNDLYVGLSLCLLVGWSQKFMYRIN